MKTQRKKKREKNAGSERGTRIKVVVRAGARRSGIELGDDGQIRIWLTAQRQRGQANTALIGFLSDILGIKRRQITIEKGHTTSTKLLCFENYTKSDLQQAVQDFLQKKKDT